MGKNKEGISLISLIITIIVIIILAAIVIFTGLGTPDRANFARFASEFSDFGLAITNDYVNRNAKYAVNGQTRSEKQIYYMIASGTEIDINDPVIPVGTIDELGLNIVPEGLEGTEYYEITSDKNVENWQKENQYYESSEKHYVTDKGEAFMLPGYLQEDNGTKKWWVNERKYYVSETPVRGASSISVSNIKVTTDAGGTTVAGNDIEEGTALYINFEASEDGAVVTVSPSLPFSITGNGEYEFTLTSTSGKTKTYTVTVNNYKEPTVANTVKVGDYVEYTPDSNTYTTDTNNTGYSPAQPLTTETADWRVLYVNESTGEVLITPNGIVNSRIFLSGTKGYFRGPTELNNICAALYSNSSLGVTARSMTVEDLDKACNYTPTTSVTRYAYYPKGTTFAEGDTTIEYKGKTYTKTAHGYSTAEFYTSDGGGVEQTDSDGFTYRVPEADNPVYVSETFYWYDPSSYNSTVSSILGNSNGWLASPCVFLYPSIADFRVRCAHSSGVSADYLYSSRGRVDSFGWGVRPLVSLGSTLQVDKSDTSRDGSAPEYAWKIIKK